MRILFNMIGCGAANNGGTSSIFNSANVLHKLGHKVILISDEKNKFTWFKLDGPEYILTDKYLDYHADVLIATGVRSVPYVINVPSFKGKKLWWVRAHENWARVDNQIFSLYRNPNITTFVNSVHLQRWIKRLTGVEPFIIRPGTDIGLFYPIEERNWENKSKWILGGLLNQKARKRFEWVPLIYKQLKELGYNVELHLFGTYDLPKKVPCDVYLQQPDKNKLREFYNKIDFWIAPTMSEGLHIPPQEAMLCACAVVGTDENLSGMRDYLEDGKTGYVMQYWTDGAEQIAKLIDGDKKELSKVVKAGRKKIIGLGSREENMKKMVKYFKGIKNEKRRYR